MADITPPTIAITANKASLKAGDTALITFTLSEVATDFLLSDITVSGGTLSNFAGSGIAYSALFTPSRSSNTPGSVTVGSLKFSDSAGNLNQDGSDINNIVSFSIDTRYPFVTIGASSRFLSSTQNSIISFTLSEPSTDFDISDISVSGGTLSSFNGSGVTYSAVYTANTSNDGVISIARGLFTDIAGNTNNNSAAFTVVPYDSLKANVVWSRPLNAPLNYLIDQATDLTVDSSGSIFVCGVARAYLDAFTLSSTTDAFITKYNPDGTQAWTNVLSTSTSEEAYTLTTGLDGSIYVSGQTYGSLDGQSNTGNGYSVAFITKYRTDGTKEWTRLLGSNFNSGKFLSTSLDGSIILVGGSSVAKYNSDGTIAWTKVLDTSAIVGAGATVDAITTGLDGSIYFSGTTTLSLDGQTVKKPYSPDCFLVKYNQDGTKAWTRVFGTNENEYAKDLTIGPDGSIYVSGQTFGSLDGQTYGGNGDGFITKYNQNGALEWMRLISTVGQDNASTLTTDIEGAIYVSGQTEISGSSGNDYITKYSADGTKEWIRILGDKSDSPIETNALTTGIDGLIYVLGSGVIMSNQWVYGSFLMKLTNTVTKSLVDTTPPTIVVTSNTNSLLASQTAVVTFKLSESSTNFTLSDITVTGGTLSNFTGTGANYSAIFTPASNGTLNGVIRVGSGVFTDAAGNANIDGLVGNNTCSITINPVQSTTYSITIDQWVGGTGRVPAGPIIAEGGTASFTLHSTNFSRETFPPGTVIPYTITGVGAADISLSGLSETGNGLISGNVTVSSSFYLNDVVANITVGTIADGITDGDKTLTVTVGGTSASVIVKDTSNAASTKEYSIQISALFDPSTEGTLVKAYIATKNVVEGSSLFYQISGTGVTSSDFDNFALFGSFKVNASEGNFLSIPISADKTTEGEETFTIQLYLDSNKTIPVGKPRDVIILDSSKGPGNPTYSISATKSSTDEGKTADFTLTTTDVPAGSIISYTLSGINSADTVGGALTGSVTLNTQGTALISIALFADNTTEGEETLNLSVMGKIASIKINDTSTSKGNDISTSKGTASSDLVYVFKSEKTGPAVNPASYSYYYTSNPEEAAYINAQANWPWVQKASTFEAAHSNPLMATPVFRFWSDKLQAPYFTISTAERDQIISWSSTGKNGYDWLYAGTGFSVYTSSAPTDALGKSAIPVYCVWMDDTDFNPANGLSGGLLFTADKVEYDGLIKLVGVTGAGVVFYGEVPGN